MRRRTLTAVVLVVVAVMALSAPMAAAAGVFADQSEDEVDESISPGERLSGAIGAQQAEVDGELQERSYGVAVAGAATDEEAADVVAERLGDVEQRLDELDERLDELENAREAGELTHGQYAAQVAGIEAERASLERQVDRANETAGELPEPVLEERGIDVDAIQTLKDRANQLGGEEVSRIAQSIAGENVGQSVAEEQRPDEVGPPGDDRGNETDRGEDRGNETDRGDEHDDGESDHDDTDYGDDREGSGYDMDEGAEREYDGASL